MFDFSGKTVLITGASGALGAALAVEFATAGANIVAASRSRYDDEAGFATGSEILADGGYGLGPLG